MPSLWGGSALLLVPFRFVWWLVRTIPLDFSEGIVLVAISLKNLGKLMFALLHHV